MMRASQQVELHQERLDALMAMAHEMQVNCKISADVRDCIVEICAMASALC